MDFAAILKAEVDRKRKHIEDKKVLGVSERGCVFTCSNKNIFTYMYVFAFLPFTAKQKIL